MSATSKKTVIAIRRQKVAAAYLRGGTQADIAVELECDQATVSRDLIALRAAWMKSALIDINEAKARELAKIDTLELEYWAAWKRSQQNAEVETTKMQGTDPAAPGKLEKQKRVEGQVGDSRYLQGVQWCVEMRCKIIGIEAPKKIQHGNDPENPLIPKLTDGERIERMKQLAVAIAEEIKKDA